jgi:hypothetical protein
LCILWISRSRSWLSSLRNWETFLPGHTPII